MVVQEKSRAMTTVKSTENDLAKTMTDFLWSYEEIKHVVRNNYVILNTIVRNAIKALNITTDNFDFESFSDNFDIHELDLKSQDTLLDSLTKLLSKFIVNKADNNVELLMEKAPYEIANRLGEVLKYLKENPHDSETISYAEELIKQLKEFDCGLASKYSRELDTILNPKPVEPKASVRVIESKAEQPKPANEPKPVVRVSEREPKARVHVNRGKIIAYIPMPEKPRVNDVNAVDVDKILRPRSPKPRSVKTDVKSNTKTAVKRKLGLRQIMDIIGKDFVNMYYYRKRY